MKFAFYSLFGWGTPLLMAILTALFDSFPNWGNIRPHMGESSCFLSIHGARFFFYMPILILLCFNTLMYLVTGKHFIKKTVISNGHLHLKTHFLPISFTIF